jgi:hypothetical protein
VAVSALPRPTPIRLPTRAEVEEIEMENHVLKDDARRLIATIRPSCVRLHALAVVGGDLQAEQLAAMTVAHLDRFARRFGGDAA